MAAPLHTPDRYLWLIEHRRMVFAGLTGSIGLVAIFLGWWGVTNSTVVADQLSYIASGSVLGIFLLGVATMAYWSEQREREMSRLTEIEVYLGAMAELLGLTEQLDETVAMDAISAPAEAAQPPKAPVQDGVATRPSSGSRRDSPPRRRARTSGAT